MVGILIAFWMLAAGRFGGSNLDAGDSSTGSKTTILLQMPPPTVHRQQTRIRKIPMVTVQAMPVIVWGIKGGFFFSHRQGCCYYR
jgi:hypothetical protein